MKITKETLPTRNFGNTRNLQSITTIVIHHTGGGIGGLVPTLRDRGLSYHFAIKPNGDILQFSEITTTAFHARHLNSQSVGIAFVGNFTTGEPTTEAYNACISLIRSLNLPNLKEIVGHGERMATACPTGVNVKLISDKLNIYNVDEQPQAQDPCNINTVAPWAKDAIDWAKQNGISDGTRPNDIATRQEVITMLFRAKNLFTSK